MRSQHVVCAGDTAEADDTGGSANGLDSTVQDSDGGTSRIDVAVRYSIRPDQVTTIHNPVP